MKIYEVAVRKPISTILIFIGVIVFGIFSLSRLAIDMYPELELPAVMVITSYPGANASDIETNITRLMEDNLNTVNNLKKMTSTSRDNVSVVTLEFIWGSDMTEAANDIRDAIGRIQSYLPDDATTPVIFKFSSSMFPVLVLSATAEESYAALNKILDEKLVNVLNRIDGVGAVSLMGNPVREIQVNVDPRKLEAYNISVEQIGQVIAMENVNVPSGMIDLGNFTYNLKTDGEFVRSDDLLQIVLASVGGRDIMLKDVAQIKDTLQKKTLDERINGQRGVRIIVQKQSGANTVEIADRIMKVLPEIEKSLPKDVKINIVMDGSEAIKGSIDALTETVMLAFLFVILVVLFFLGRWRATLIICLAIPISLVVAFIYLYLTGGTINIISLSSLTIAIGMVVDDAIVVLENITKHIEKGSSPKEAGIYGTNEVWIAVIASTLTVIAVFLPLTMVGGLAGIMFKQLGWIVSLTIAMSAVVAVTLTPMLSSLMLKGQKRHVYKGFGVLFKPVDRFLDNLDSLYERLLLWVMHHKTATILYSFGIFAASLLLLTKVPVELFAANDDGIMSAQVKLEQNVGVDYTVKIARQIDSIIYAKYPEIRILSTSAGVASSSSAFTALRTSGSYIINYMMRLPKVTERKRSIFQITELLREDLAKIPEIREYTVTPGSSMGGMGGGSTIDLKVFGYDFNATDAVARDLMERLKQLKGTRDVYLSRDDLRPEYNISLDRNKLAYYGLNSSSVSQGIRNRINGLTATKYREEGEEYDVIVRYDEPFRTSIEDVENITIYNNRGLPIRVKDIGSVVEEVAPPAIERENRQRVITVHSALGDGVALGTVAKEVQAMLPDVTVPEGVYVEIGGSFEDQQESFRDILILFALVVLLVYIVMATQFESFVTPFINMITVFFAFTGVFLALFITNTPLGMIALIGAVMLVGIVVKNGIVMVDYMNLLRERGNTVFLATVKGGRSRLRPVLMTSFATILGMLPLALSLGEGSETWRPMGIAIIGGLSFSMLLTLLVIPAFYAWMYSYHDRRKGHPSIAKQAHEFIRQEKQKKH